MSSLFQKVWAVFWTRRFLKFATVGFSGVLVNLGALYLVNIIAGVQHNLAAAIAIEVSVCTNFIANELWTFRDRRAGAGGVVSRGMKFQLVSLGGAAIQWATFFASNLALAALVADVGPLADSPPLGIGAALWRALSEPPDLGAWIFISQIAGIGVATAWNFCANVFWTWGPHPKGRES